MLLILGGLAALIAIIGLGGGFILATAMLFATTSPAFGRRALLADLAIGFVLGHRDLSLLFDQAADARACPPARSNGCCEGIAMDTFAALGARLGWSRCSR